MLNFTHKLPSQVLAREAWLVCYSSESQSVYISNDIGIKNSSSFDLQTHPFYPKLRAVIHYVFVAILDQEKHHGVYDVLFRKGVLYLIMQT